MSEPSPPCEHRFVFLRAVKEERRGSYASTWTRIDCFFCEKCLETREQRKSEDSRGEPAWWRAEP